MNDTRLLETVRDRFRLTTATLSGLLDVGDRRVRRVLAGEDALPGSARLLLQLLAARPDLMPTVQRLREGLPLDLRTVCDECDGRGIVLRTSVQYGTRTVPCPCCKPST